MIVYIGIGSNVGDVIDYCERAIMMVDATVGTVRDVSSLRMTKPYGGVKQSDFCNGVIVVETKLSPRALLQQLKQIEVTLDRKPTVRWGPRTIDLDILFYGDWVVREGDLIIPHADFSNREFVLEPMVEVAPDFVDPRSKKTMRELYRKLLSR